MPHFISPREFADALNDVADEQTQSQSQHGASSLSRSSSSVSAQSSKGRPAALSADAVLSLYSNCIKLASENKINAKNTWSLALIDHISEIVRDSKDEDGQTNFQKSSCTLDAGVKIYASRVDSFHSETFKMLGGMNKVSQQEEVEGDESEGHKGDGAEGSQAVDGEEGDENARKKRATRAVATLEAPESHSTKALEEAVVVDPLFQKTSALFDEGGASGLLLNNLSVHRGCNICFDSEEVPDYTDVADDNEPPLKGVTIDLTSIRDVVESASRSAATAARITPTIAVIEDMLTELTGADAPSAAAAAAAAANSGGANGVSLFDFSQGSNGSPGGVQFAEYDDDDEEGVRDEDDFGGAALDFGGLDDDAGFDEKEEGGSFGHHANGGGFGAVLAPDSALDADGPAGLEWVIQSGMGGKMAWAGPSHWRFKAPPKSTAGATAGEDDEAGVKPKTKRAKGELTFDFENPGEPDEARFTLAATSEELLLVSAPTAVDTLLPADLGYEAKDLVRLSLRPNAGVTDVMGAKGVSGGDFDSRNEAYGDDSDDGDFGGGGFDDEDGDVDGFGSADDGQLGADGLVAAPRRVEKIRVNYARATKQVDVKELKATLWENINDPAVSNPDTKTGAHSFHDLLQKFPEDNMAGNTEDISVHMAFICMLHLANEHGLKITDRPCLSDLDISNLPASAVAS